MFAKEIQHEIRVLVFSETPKLEIRGYDLEIKDSQKTIITNQISHWIINCENRTLSFRNRNDDRQNHSNSHLWVKSLTGQIHINHKPYFDRIRISSHKGRCQVVNHLDIEKYLQGVVNLEFSTKWNRESIGAQIVAARTYAYFQKRFNRGKDFDLDSTVRDQLYSGTANEDGIAAMMVKKTRGWILTSTPSPHLDAMAIKAFYHSTCAGATEVPQNVWGRSFEGYKTGVKCPYCYSSPIYHWKTQLSAVQIQNAIQRGFAISLKAPSNLQNGFFLSLAIEKFDPTGRAALLNIEWGQGKEKSSFLLPASRFRDWIGPSVLKSTYFEVTQAGNAMWNFKGRGNGHGVGMCQWGAKIMGDKGFSMAAILKYYYPDAKLTKLW